MKRIFEVAQGVSILGVVAGMLAFIFPIHERLYAWPFVALAVYGWLVLLAVVIAIRLIIGPRELVVKVVV